MLRWRTTWTPQQVLALAPDTAGANAQAFAALGVPTFACTPDLFPDLMAAAIEKRDIGAWAVQAGIVASRG